MKENKNQFRTKTTVFNSLDQMCRAIPKINNRGIGGYGQPVIKIDDPIWTGPNLRIGEFIYLFPENLKNLTDEEITILISDFKGINNYEFFSNVVSKFKDKNEITPAGLIENIEPGIIYWFKEVKTGDDLFYLDSILPRFNKEYVDEFVSDNLFCSQYNLVRRFIQNLCLQRRLTITNTI